TPPKIIVGRAKGGFWESPPDKRTSNAETGTSQIRMSPAASHEEGHHNKLTNRPRLTRPQIAACLLKLFGAPASFFAALTKLLKQYAIPMRQPAVAGIAAGACRPFTAPQISAEQTAMPFALTNPPANCNCSRRSLNKARSSGTRNASQPQA